MLPNGGYENKYDECVYIVQGPPKLITASPHDTTATAMRLMTTHFVRQLPLLEHGQVMGVVSIGDIIKAHHDELAVENHCMKAYIQGESAELREVAMNL